MINLKDPKDQTPNAIAIVGAVLGVGALVVTGFLKPQTPSNRKHNTEMLAVKTKFEQAEKDIEAHKGLIGRFRWDQKLDDVAPAALDTVTSLTKQYNLTLVSFRPQKVVESASLIQLPFQMIVDGSFVNVANLVQSLETSDSKLAVQQIQYAGQEGETDLVTANINLIAFVKKADAKAAKPADKAIPTATAGAKKNG